MNEGYQISLQSSNLAKNVYLHTEAAGAFSDNYFDLLPGERKTVLFKTDSILDSAQTAFQVKHLQQTYNR